MVQYLSYDSYYARMQRFVLGAVQFNDIHCSFPHKLIFAVLEQIAEIQTLVSTKIETLR